MKYILYVVFLFFEVGTLTSQCTTTQTIQNGLDVSFDQMTEQVIISGIDPCSYTAEELETLECYDECNKEYETYLKECLKNANGLIQISRCRDLAFQKLHFCESDCGEEPQSSRTVVSYQYAVQLWYNTGFVETFDGDPRERIVSEQINSRPPYSLVVNLENELPEESLSYCYFTEVLIQYDDGSCCYFQDFACFNKG